MHPHCSQVATGACLPTVPFFFAAGNHNRSSSASPLGMGGLPRTAVTSPPQCGTVKAAPPGRSRRRSGAIAASLGHPNGNGVMISRLIEVARMSASFQVELKVRDYELDQFGVVNNAVYASYCQHGHHEFLDKIGFNVEDVLRAGEMLALSEFSLKFISPLRNGDRFIVKVKVTNISSARIFLEDQIIRLPTHEPILEAKATVVWLDKNMRPTRISSELKSKLAEYARNCII